MTFCNRILFVIFLSFALGVSPTYVAAQEATAQDAPAEAPAEAASPAADELTETTSEAPDAPAEETAEEPSSEATESSEDTAEESPTAPQTQTTSGPPAAENPTTPDQVSAIQAPTPLKIGQNGAMVWSVPIAVPSYRGLEPRLALTYSSANRRMGRPDNFIASGWTLSGLSVIERVSPGRGTPWFDNNLDIFMIDGMELLACNAWTGVYPSDWRASDTNNASCDTGGTHTTLIESYRKIRRIGSEWHVWSKDGTQFIYKTPDDLGVDTTGVTGDDLQLATNTRWYLAEIRNTQSVQSVVAYSYLFDGFGRGLAPRPDRITYTDYEVRFRYVQRASGTEPTFATGTDRLGEQRFQLVTVEVKDLTAAPNRIRAYGLSYTTSAEVLAQLLDEVQIYGKDYGLTNGVVTSGTPLSGQAIDFSYSSDQLTFSRVRYDNELFSTNSIFADFNNDGRDEALFLPYEAKGTQCNAQGVNCQDVVVYDLDGAHYVFSETNTIESKSTTGLPTLENLTPPGPAPANETNMYAGGSLQGDLTGTAGFFYVSTSRFQFESGPCGNCVDDYRNFQGVKIYELPGSNPADPTFEIEEELPDYGSNNFLAPSYTNGDFDGDGLAELIVGDTFQDFNPDTGELDPDASWTFPSNFFTRATNPFFILDFSGDGKQDILRQNVLFRSTGTGFSAQALEVVADWLSGGSHRFV